MGDWFEKVFNVPRKTFKVRLSIYPQQDEKKIKQFWSLATGIPITNFGKTFVKPLNRGCKKNNLCYGTIKVEIPKGTNMRHRVFGWIKAVLHGAEPRIEVAQKEWKSLREVQRPVNLPK